MSRSITWIDETREAVDRASNLVRAQAEFERLEEAEKELDDALGDLSALHAAANLGRGTWWPGLDAPPDVCPELLSLQEDLGPQRVRSVLSKLATHRSRLGDAVRMAWREHITSRAGDAGGLRELVQVLAGADGLADIAHSLDEALGRLAQLQKAGRGTTLPDAKAVQALNDAVDLLDVLEKRLPAAVKAFVSAAARGGASLDLLDAKVRAWLVENGALNNFRIVPGQRQEVRRG
jgi:hypothetical protein